MTKGSVGRQGLLTMILLALLLVLGAQTAGARDTSAALAAQQEEPVVRFYLFYGESCPHCHEVIDNFLPTVYEKYGDQVEYEYLEVWSDPGEGVTPETVVPQLPWVHAMRQQAMNFVAAIRGEIQPLCEAPEALEDLRVAREYIRLLTGEA